MTRVLALTKYGREAASTRQRLMQFLPALESVGFNIDVRPLLHDDYVRALVSGSAYPKAKLMKAYVRRFRDLAHASRYDLLWIYAELFPGLPALFEQLALRAGKPIIYDCDDAFFHSHERSRLLRDKLRPLIAGAELVAAGNDYLAAHARRWNDKVQIIPTVVDTCAYRPRSEPSRSTPPVIGWIGSPSTWSYVRPLLPLLADLCRRNHARFLAIGAGNAATADYFDGMELRTWSECREIADVQMMDIGIMPLPDEPWAWGKCGYKLIQYMACGLPTVASPVGVNTAIVREGKTGYLALNERDWVRALKHLIDSPEDRARLGAAGRARAIESYSLATWTQRVVEIFLSAKHGSQGAAMKKESQS